MHTSPAPCGSWVFVGPFGGKVWYPEDEGIALRLASDGRVYQVQHYTVVYGERYLFTGHELPVAKEQWRFDLYLPEVETEILIVRLASRDFRFRDIVARCARPRLEVAAILNFHGYPGLQYARHGDIDW